MYISTYYNIDLSVLCYTAAATVPVGRSGVYRYRVRCVEIDCRAVNDVLNKV